MNNRAHRMMKRLPFLLILSVSASLFFLSSPFFSSRGGFADDLKEGETSSDAGHVAVVTSPMFVPPLKRWITYRQSQGYRVHLLIQKNQTDVTNRGTALPSSAVPSWAVPSPTEASPTPESIRRQIRELAAEVPLKAILIVGDGAPLTGESASPEDSLGSAPNIIPAPRIAPKVINRFGPENHIASDGWFADLDDDSFPDLAVGRLPVRTPKQLENAIDKILYYERMAAPGEWQRRISFIAGLAGFSPLLDNVINNAVRQTLAASIPDDFDFFLAQANWKSPYCPDPTLFRFTTIDQINQGPLFWVYMGHGLNRELDRFTTPEGNFKILEIDDIRHVDCRTSLPVMIFCACYTGAYDSTEPSLAEEFFLAPKGPVAVIASSRTSMPYGMAVFGVEMIEETFTRSDSPDSLTLGELAAAAKRRMTAVPTSARKRGIKEGDPETVLPAANESDAPEEKGTGEKETADGLEEIGADDRSKTRRSLDNLARMFDPTGPELVGQLEDHRNLFNLFGDPLLRIRFPKRIAIRLPEIGYASETVTVASELTLPGETETETETETEKGRAPSETSDWSPVEGFESTESEADVLVELVSLPTRPKIRDANRNEFSLTDQDRIQFQRTFEKANDRIFASAAGKTQNGRFAVELPIPAETSGVFIVRVLVTEKNQTKTGAKRIRIRKRTETDKPE